MQNGDVAETTRILQNLLMSADVPNGQGGPILLSHQNFDTASIAEICVVNCCRRFPKHSESAQAPHETISADEYIKGQLALGFKVMSMFIGNAVYGGGIQHDVVAVLVKLKTN